MFFCGVVLETIELSQKRSKLGFHAVFSRLFFVRKVTQESSVRTQSSGSLGGKCGHRDLGRWPDFRDWLQSHSATTRSPVWSSGTQEVLWQQNKAQVASKSQRQDSWVKSSYIHHFSTLSREPCGFQTSTLELFSPFIISSNESFALKPHYVFWLWCWVLFAERQKKWRRQGKDFQNSNIQISSYKAHHAPLKSCYRRHILLRLLALIGEQEKEGWEAAKALSISP